MDYMQMHVAGMVSATAKSFGQKACDAIAGNLFIHHDDVLYAANACAEEIHRFISSIQEESTKFCFEDGSYILFSDYGFELSTMYDDYEYGYCDD